MLKSLPDVFRSFWSKSANDNSPHAAGRKRKREETEWDDDPDCQIVKVEKKRKTESFWNFFNLPSKMADWIRLKHRPFSEQFSATSKVSNRNIKETRRNGASNAIPFENGSEDSDSWTQIPKGDNRLGHPSHNRGMLNGEHRMYSHTSRLSDRASSDTSNLKPWRSSTLSMCIRLNEKEEYQKLLKMQMIRSNIHASDSLNSQRPSVESDRLSVSSNNSSNDVSLLRTSQCLSQLKHTSRDHLSIPQYKTTPRKISSSLLASSTSLYPQRLRTNDMMPPRALLSLIARQKKRATHSEKIQNEKKLSKPSEEGQQTVVVSDDDDVLIIESDEDKAPNTASKPSRDQEGVSQSKELSSTGKSNRLGFLDSVYTRDGYLQEINKSRLMYSEQWKRQAEEQEMKAQAYEQKRRAQGLELERRLKHQMRIFDQEPEVSEDIFIEKEEEQEEEEEVLPDLTDSMMEVIKAAMRPSPPGEVLSDAFSLKITRRDIATLGGLNWLNDEIINFYMNMLMDRGKQDGMPKVYAFNTFFYPKIMSGGHSAVKRWTKKVDIFAMHYIVIPVHLGMHWCLCVVNMKDKVITYYDSMGARNQECLLAVLKYVNDESVAKKQTSINESEWKLVTATENPHQMNGGDCGMFACKYAEYITRGKEISFTQNDMPYFRLRMVYEIVTKKLLQ